MKRSPLRSSGARERGRHAELAVADYLFASGFDVFARNLRLGHLELDIVARRGALLVVTEVRTRGPGSFLGPFASVTRTKRTRLRTAVARLWRERTSQFAGVERVRIDVAAVTFAAGQTRIVYAAGALG